MAMHILQNWTIDSTFAATFDTVSPVTTKVIDLICGAFGVEPDDVQPDTRLEDDLRLDEIDMVDLVVMLDEEFGIEISDEAWQNLKTCGDVVSLVKRLIRERGA